jgi:predicted nucleic acid-binding protein
MTGDPPEMAIRATAALTGEERLLLPDLVVAECVYVLASYYRVRREQIAELIRSAIALPCVETVDRRLLMRSLQLYELEHLDFADAYLVASAEATGVGAILSFDRDLDRVATVARLEP